MVEFGENVPGNNQDERVGVNYSQRSVNDSGYNSRESIPRNKSRLGGDRRSNVPAP